MDAWSFDVAPVRQLAEEVGDPAKKATGRCVGKGQIEVATASPRG